MSRAYCLTCNEQVHETPSGTCPLGHPVTTADHGPEPWVGFAEVEGRAVTTHVDHALEDDVPMERLDAAGRPVAHVGAAAAGHLNGHVNGHANGHVNGHANGHGVPSGLLDGPADDGHAADDLAALLAEALQQEDAPATDDEPDTDATALWDADWDELSGLAAELQLDADHGVDDGPAAPPAPLADAATETDEVADLDALLAELTGDAPTEPPAPAPVAPPPPTPVDEAPPAPPVVPPPPPAPVVESVVDPVPPFEDVPSPAPVDDTTSLWDDPQDPVDDVPPAAPEVDLTNFTARGSRVGGGGSAGSTRSWFRKKTR